MGSYDNKGYTTNEVLQKMCAKSWYFNKEKLEMRKTWK
jgi:hypothetical protein